MQTIQFNTGREYTEHGQRIIATQLDDGQIVVLDLDRHIDLMLPATVEFTQADIMQAYDHGWQIFPDSIGMTYGDYYELLAQMRGA